jgi:sodium-dependent dicarboxylate transporter 2/3/5
MVFGVPLAFGLLAAALALVALRLRPSGRVTLPTVPPAPPGHGLGRLGLVFGVVIVLWLTETLHGVPAWVVALGAVAALLATRLVGWRDLLRLDWATLVLIAGGIALGALLERSGLVRELAAQLPIEGAPPVARLLLLCLTCALLSALMSNTGTASFLVPLAATIDPSPSTAVIVAVSASLGVPFVISTPPNAMAVAGGLRSTDLLGPGLLLMIGGCVLVALTGPWVLRLVGIP